MHADNERRGGDIPPRHVGDPADPSPTGSERPKATPSLGATAGGLDDSTGRVPLPAPPPAIGAAQQLSFAVQRWRNREIEFGKQLLVLGSGPVPISGTDAGAVGLDRDGRVVFIAATRALTVRSVTEIVDHLDRIAQLGSTRLNELEPNVLHSESLETRHARFFTLPRAEKPKLNAEQQVVLLVDEPPTEAMWKTMVLEFGPLFGEVVLCGAGGPQILQPPESLLRPSLTSSGRWPLINWIGLLVVLLGAGLGVLGLARFLEDEEVSPVLTSIDSPIREVVGITGADATHTQWIGQQRSVRTSRGNVLFLFSQEGALQIVSDQGNQGRTWRTPTTVDGLSVDSFSAVIDQRDRIHLAFQGPAGAGYARLRQSAEGWSNDGVLELDTSTTSHIIDLAWDPRRQRAHVVWVGQEPNGEQVMWSAVRSDRGTPLLDDETVLAGPGGDATVLATIDVDPTDGDVLVTYRAPNEAVGWFSRIGSETSPDIWEWEPEERLPIDEIVGAASVSFDRRGTAHLILRDSTGFDLEYFRRTDRAGWSSGELVVDSTSIEYIDMPTMAVDDVSRLVYLFFHSSEFNPAYEIRVTIRDPASGWEGPFEVAAPHLIPEGAYFPTALSPVNGQPLVFWTKKGSAPAVQLARVSAP